MSVYLYVWLELIEYLTLEFQSHIAKLVDIHSTVSLVPCPNNLKYWKVKAS